MSTVSFNIFFVSGGLSKNAKLPSTCFAGPCQQKIWVLLIYGIMHHFKGILTQWSEYVGP